VVGADVELESCCGSPQLRQYAAHRSGRAPAARQRVSPTPRRPQVRHPAAMPLAVPRGRDRGRWPSRPRCAPRCSRTPRADASRHRDCS